MELHDVPTRKILKLFHPEYPLCRLTSLRVGGDAPAVKLHSWNPVDWIGWGDLLFLEEFHCTAAVLSTGTVVSLTELSPALRTLAFVHYDTIDIFTKWLGPSQSLRNLRHLKLWSYPADSLWDFQALPGLDLLNLETLQLHRCIHLAAGTVLEAVKTKDTTRTKPAIVPTIIPNKVIYPRLRSLTILISDPPQADHISFALQVAAMVRPRCKVSFMLSTESTEAEEWCRQAKVGLDIPWNVTSGRMGWSIQNSKRKRKAADLSTS